MYSNSKYNSDLSHAKDLECAAKILIKASGQYSSIKSNLTRYWISADGYKAINAFNIWAQRLNSYASDLSSEAVRIRRAANQLYEEYKREQAASSGGGGRGF